jgi:preprotein translocase subunit SecD
MRNRGLGRTFFNLMLILLLAAAAGYVLWPNNKGIHIGGYNNSLDWKFGLDIKGGIQFVLEASCPPDQPKCDIPAAMPTVQKSIENRINGGLALTDAIVTQEGNNRLVVQLPGLTDDTQARQLLGRTGQMLIIDTGSQSLPVGTDVTGLTCTTECGPNQYKIQFKGNELDTNSVSAGLDSSTQQPIVTFQFKGDAQARFADYTAKNVGNYLTITLDNKVIESAVIQSQITGQGQISGSMTVAQANDLATLLKYGALPLPLTIISEQQLAPTLGAQAIQESIRAAIIGLALVMIFMLVVYRLPGLLADFALLLYAVYLFATIKFLGVTLSLPGIAAVVLTIGMAVDANILIFERMKEELRGGRTLAAAVDLGFKRAWPSIRDSNFSTMITCAILYIFGNNFGATIIVGFAINLFIGVLISLFTAIFVTRTFLNLLVPTGVATHPGLFGLPQGALNVPRYNRPATRMPAKAPAPALAGASRGTNGASSESKNGDALASDGASDEANDGADAVATAGETEE